ncbi:MAG: TRAP transporter large permease subunit, partial [Alphaproteobacteria bacterium]
MFLTFLLIALFALILLRMPIAFAMGLAGAAGMAVQVGVPATLSLFERVVFEGTSHFILVAIPLFILMAELMTAGGITTKAVAACQAWLGHFRGGLAIATVGAAVMLAALIGSSTASSATMASSAYPEMKRLRYHDRLSAAIVSVGGTLAVMIPPSIIFIVYGVLTETSIGKLFMAGVVPGLLTAAGFIPAVILIARRPGMAPAGGPFDLRHAIRRSHTIWPMCALIVLVIATIYTGAASPTEAGAVGAAGALLIALLQRS